MKKTSLFVPLVFFLGASAMAQTIANVPIRGRNQELHIYGVPANPSIVLSSGDLGWAGLVVHVAEFLGQNGYYVIGLNSKAYLEGFTSKSSTLSAEDVSGDYLTLIEFVKRSNSIHPILAGISEGAGLSVLAATNPEVKQAIHGILALGLPDQNELGWKWQDFTIWITKKAPNEPGFRVSEIIKKISPIPLAEIHATHDEFLSIEKAKEMIALADEPKRMWIIEADNHRFSNARNELDRTMIEALTWIRQLR